MDVVTRGNGAAIGSLWVSTDTALSGGEARAEARVDAESRRAAWGTRSSCETHILFSPEPDQVVQIQLRGVFSEATADYLDSLQIFVYKKTS